MPYIVKIPQFEGPLDQLLTLAQQGQVDLREIPLAQIAEAYLAGTEHKVIGPSAEEGDAQAVVEHAHVLRGVVLKDDPQLVSAEQQGADRAHVPDDVYRVEAEMHARSGTHSACQCATRLQVSSRRWRPPRPGRECPSGPRSACPPRGSCVSLLGGSKPR